MKIIYRYLIKKFVGPFILTFLFSLFILIMQFLWLYVDDLVGKGLEVSIILELIFYASAGFVSKAAPLAILLSSLMTFGSLGEYYELVALKSAGIPISKLMFSLSIFAFSLGIFAFWFGDQVAPKAFLTYKNLFYSIKDKKPTLAIEEGVFYDGFDNYVIRIGKKLRDNETIEDVLLYDHSKFSGNSTMTYAKKGKMKVSSDGQFMLFYLYDGYFWDENKNGSNSEIPPLTRSHFKEQYKRFDISSFGFQKMNNSYYETITGTLSNAQIKVRIDTIKKEILDISDNAVRNFYSNLQFLNLYMQNDTMPLTGTIVNYQEQLQLLSKDKKQNVINYALYQAGFIKNTVDYTYDEEEFKSKSLWGFQAEWWKKHKDALACVLFFFIGAPLGSIMRKGGIGIPLLITVLFFIIYFSISIMGEKMAKGNIFPVWFGMWLSSLILVPICIFLTTKATNDSSIL
ncbi:MAG: LptF/LptG family permease, partial [Bacteroidales bacterium]|nr:LptF/LptG family permease [Bacteroidales bacterium]